MVKAKDRFDMRISAEDRRHLRTLAERSQRTEAAVVRLLIRQVAPEHIGIGIAPLALPMALEQAQPPLDAA